MMARTTHSQTLVIDLTTAERLVSDPERVVHRRGRRRDASAAARGADAAGGSSISAALNRRRLPDRSPRTGAPKKFADVKICVPTRATRSHDAWRASSTSAHSPAGHARANADAGAETPRVGELKGGVFTQSEDAIATLASTVGLQVVQLRCRFEKRVRALVEAAIHPDSPEE